MGLFDNDNDNDNGNNQSTMNNGLTPNGFLPAAPSTPAMGDASPGTDHTNEFIGNLNPVQHLMAVKTGLVTHVNGSTHTMQQAEGNGTGRTQSPDTVYDPDNRRDYDADGGVLPKGVKPDIFPIEGNSYWQTRRGQIWKQTGDGQWATVPEHEAQEIRRKRRNNTQQATDGNRNETEGYDDSSAAAISGGAGFGAGRAVRKWLDKKCPCLSDVAKNAAESGTGLAVESGVDALLPKKEK